jgi:hypothetical protein
MEGRQLAERLSVSCGIVQNDIVAFSGIDYAIQQAGVHKDEMLNLAEMVQDWAQEIEEYYQGRSNGD